MPTRRQFLHRSVAALAASGLPSLAWAQGWPAKQPIRAMIPFSAGSTLDIVGRIVLEPLSSQLGQTIVIENRGGAGGTIGTAAVAKADADGYTLLINASAHSAAPAAYPSAPYDAARDFSAVIPFGTVPNVTVIAPAKGIKSLQELVAAAKSGSLTYASAGVGSATHWAAERLRASAGFTAVHVPFRGGPEALTEVMTGRVDFTCMGMSSALGFIRDGKLVPLAVSTPKRSRALPDVPTTIEAGLADSDYNYWMACSCPRARRARSSKGCTRRRKRCCGCPQSCKNSPRREFEPMELTPAEFDALIRKEIESNIALVRAAGLKFN